MRVRIREVIATNGIRDGVANGAYGVADYLSQPLIMFWAAPFLLHTLGAAQYGLWMLIMAIVGSAGAISAGFGTAAIKYVATYKGREDWEKVVGSIRCSLTLNLLFGCVLGLVIIAVAPVSVRYLFRIDSTLSTHAVAGLRLGGIVVLVRSLECVFAASLRAYQRYDVAVRISVISRTVVVLASVLLAGLGFTIVSMMAVSIIVGVVSLAVHMCAARGAISGLTVLPSFDRKLLREQWHFGAYSWLQVVTGIAFNYGDRMVIAGFLGIEHLALYSICVQIAQPIHGILASGLNVVFPWASSNLASKTGDKQLSTLRSLVILNFAASAVLTTALLIISKPLLVFWMGKTFADQAWTALCVVSVGFGLVSVNIAPHYILLASGQVRYLTLLNLAATVIAMLATLICVPIVGLLGAPIGRLFYGPVTWTMFSRLGRVFSNESRPSQSPLISSSAISQV
ncbi:MAG TPA: oligosaccharide flippase family protein [Terriglobales bacterium]|nr:oligosaccharide flippase family protein [Terriglobales bacterium]